MTLKVAINGYGRIGRMLVRAWQERYADSDIEIVAINDLGKPELHEHLTRFDSVHGTFAGSVNLDGDALVELANGGGREAASEATEYPA